MIESREVFSQNVLENMDDGVMTLDMKGIIVMFNPAASSILGVEREEALNRSFAEVFLLPFEENDEFNQAILDAISNKDTVHNYVIDFRRRDGKLLSLSLKSTYLRSSSGERDKSFGIIVVFSDVTELKKLEERQKKLNSDLTQAYLQLEENSANLIAANKKAKLGMIFAGGFVLALLFALAVFTWKSYGVSAGFDKSSKKLTTVKLDENTQLYKVKYGPISSGITLSGKFEPLQMVNIPAPFDGQILERKFSYGQVVTEGTPLVRLDPTEARAKLGEAKSAYVKAVQEYEKMRDWEKESEVSQARRSLDKAKSNLESNRRKLEETKLLLEKGIVMRSEYDNLREQVRANEAELASAEDALRSARKKGGGDFVDVARLNMENARSKLEDMETRSAMSTITAPVGGVLIKPFTPQGEKPARTVEKGGMVQKGDLLLSIGDLSGLAVVAKVDEVDVVKLSPGQSALVYADAFPGESLNATLSDISAHAAVLQQGMGGGQGSSFDAKIVITGLSAEQRRKFRLGMSARAEVSVYENPKALLIPLKAVKIGSGKRFVVLKEETGLLRQTEIQTGVTTPSMVEVLAGLKEGDEVVIPNEQRR